MGQVAAGQPPHGTELATDVPAAGAIGGHRVHRAIDQGRSRQRTVVAGQGGIAGHGHAAPRHGAHIGEITPDEQGGMVGDAVEGAPHEQAPSLYGQRHCRAVQPRIPGSGIVMVLRGIQSRQAGTGGAADDGEVAARVEQAAIRQQQAMHRGIGAGIPGGGPVGIDGIGVDCGDTRPGGAADDGEVAARVEQAVGG